MDFDSDILDLSEENLGPEMTFKSITYWKALAHPLCVPNLGSISLRGRK